MKCKEWINGRPCGGKMKYGKAMVPVLGVLTPDFLGDSRKPRRGQTLNQVDAKMGTVLKCEKCGHSVSKGG